MIASLHSAISCLVQAHAAYTKAHYDEIDDWDDEAPAHLPRHLERLQTVRRSLEEMVGLASAVGEDELVQTALHQHELAMYAREQAEASYACEERHCAKLSSNAIEMKRNIANAARLHQRLGTASGTERERALERCSAAMEAEKAELHNEAMLVLEAHGQSTARNREIESGINKVVEALSVATEENLKAQRALGPGHNVESYRKAKDRERAVANTDLMSSTAMCELEMAQLREKWSRAEARYQAEMLELSEEAQSLQRMHEEKKAQAEDLLSKQSAAWGKTAVDIDTRINHDIASLDALCQQKAMALRRETLNSRQRVKESAAGTSRRMEAQLREVKLTYKTRLKLEEAKSGDAIIMEHRAVQDAKQEATWWEKRANRMRENYKAHAVKSGAYIKQMDPKSRQELVRLFGT